MTVCLVVCNLAHAATEDDLTTIFSNHQILEGSQVTEDGTQCIGFVFLEDEDEAKRAVEDLDRSFYDSRRIRVVLLSDYEKEQQQRKGTRSDDRPAKRRKHNQPDMNRTDLTNLYVCPIPAGIVEDHVLQLFSQYGRVKKVTILHHHRGGKEAAGKPGFVDFHLNSDARKCMSTMHGRPLSTFFHGAPEDRTLTVRFSDSHNKNDTNGKKLNNKPQTKTKNEPLTYPDPTSAFESVSSYAPIVNAGKPTSDSNWQQEKAQLLSLLEAEKTKNVQLSTRLKSLQLCNTCLQQNQQFLSLDSHYHDRRTQSSYQHFQSSEYATRNPYSP